MSRRLIPQAPAETSDVTVVGAGVIGVATAYELADRGLSVTLLERDPAVGMGCSGGNAGMLSADSVVPLASADAIREGVRWLLRPAGALGLKPSPAALPWIMQFLIAASATRYRQGAEVLAHLAEESLSRHGELAERLETAYVQRGYLRVYESPSAFTKASGNAGPRSEILTGVDARRLCPQLAVEPAGALFQSRGAHCDPTRFTNALAESAVQRGVRLVSGVEVLGLRRVRDRVVSLTTTAGEKPVGELVLAAGSWTPSLARHLPVRIPIRGGKGYHIDYDAARGDVTMPVSFAERRVVVTPMGPLLRVAGMLEIVGTDMTVDQLRVGRIVRDVGELLTGMVARPTRRIWRGLRPCSPDGLPIVGRLPGIDNVTLATGHGMWGLQLAPVTGRLIGDLLAGRPDHSRLHALRPERFEWRATARQLIQQGVA